MITEGKYYIEDFTEKNYQRLLQIAKSNNTICNFMEALKVDKGIILRHDIDSSVHRAYALSQIENTENVQSTFFVYLHSQFYNVLEKEITDLLKKIVCNGSLIGLHFEPSYYNLRIDDKELLCKKIQTERVFLEEVLGVEVDYLSFHNPDIGGDWHKIDELHLGGGINVYSRFFRDNFEYCSDSNGYWRFQRLEDVLENSENKKIQILTHPAWWQKEPMYPYERLKRCVEGRAINNLESYNKMLAKSGRLNVKGNNI